MKLRLQKAVRKGEKCYDNLNKGKKMKNIEQKYFELKLLGVLDSRKLFAEYYNKSDLDTKRTLPQHFIEFENISALDFDEFVLKHNENIRRIATLATQERIQGFGSREFFLRWYLNEPKRCCYCGVEESQLEEYFNSNNAQYKDARQRGTVLEIERVTTAPKEKNIYSFDNTALACYICNNAKSDFLSAKDFKPIALGISEFWKSKNIQVVFPKNSKFWN